MLHVSLQDAGMPSKVPTEKQLHWHIDYMLDLDAAEIQAVVVVRNDSPN
jgi:Uri superfamily endonuclease